MSEYVIVYRNEFSTLVEAKNPEEAINKVSKNPWDYEWQCIGDLHVGFLEHDSEWDDDYVGDGETEDE